MYADVGAKPAILIVLPFEGRPQVRCDFRTDGDEARVVEWLEAHPALLALIQDALELARAA